MTLRNEMENENVMPRTVKCRTCGKTVRVDNEGFLRNHKKQNRGSCMGSGRHISFNTKIGN